MKQIFLFIFLGILLLWNPAMAELEICPIFGKDAVLQRQMKIPIWGWSTPGTEVKVELAGQKKTNRTNKDGRWLVIFDPIEGPGPFTIIIRNDSGEQIISNNVLVGEVWLCGGQSNMTFTVNNTLNAKWAKSMAKNLSQIRYFNVPKGMAYHPQNRLSNSDWILCGPENVGKFSAVAFYFAENLTRTLDNIPVGLMHASKGGSTLEHWMNRHSLESVDEFRPIITRWMQGLEKKVNYESRFQEYVKMNEIERLNYKQSLKEKRRINGKKNQKIPMPTTEIFGRKAPVCGYNRMIYPLIPMAMRGVIFYQGEANVNRAEQYRKLFPAMIHQWRNDWGRKFPFLYVQIANYYRKEKQPPTTSPYAELREAQFLAQKIDNTAMVVSFDTGEEQIHSRNKRIIGRRLSLAAQAIAYSGDVAFSGPIYKNHQIEENKIKISFTHVYNGLRCEGLKVKGFALAGEDGKWFWAERATIIDDDTVLVSSSKVPRPIAVRYGWARNIEVNLENSEGLPCCPFRTDDWPMETKGKR